MNVLLQPHTGLFYITVCCSVFLLNFCSQERTFGAHRLASRWRNMTWKQAEIVLQFHKTQAKMSKCKSLHLNHGHLYKPVKSKSVLFFTTALHLTMGRWSVSGHGSWTGQNSGGQVHQHRALKCATPEPRLGSTWRSCQKRAPADHCVHVRYSWSI